MLDIIKSWYSELLVYMIEKFCAFLLAEIQQTRNK